MSTSKMAKLDRYEAGADEKLSKTLVSNTSSFTMEVRV